MLGLLTPLLVATTASADCICQDRTLCRPLSTPAPPREVFAFFTGNWTTLDFTTMTTAAAFTAVDPQLVCHAHSRGVRVVRAAPFNVSAIENATARAEWVATELASVQAAGLDGLNLDIEQYTGSREPLTALVTELHTALKAWDGHSQLSFDLAIFPDGQAKYYDHKALANVLDFIVPMAYDEPWGSKVAAANSPIGSLDVGVAQYLRAGVPASKLVIGLPWYGWDFPCAEPEPVTTPTAPDAAAAGNTTCAVVPPTGRPWYGWATQVAYGQVMATARQAGASPVTDAVTDTKHFDYTADSGKARGRHQIWFDDPDTLQSKYARCKNLGARGVAFWTADMPDSKTPSEGRQMWQAIDKGFPKPGGG